MLEIQVLSALLNFLIRILSPLRRFEFRSLASGKRKWLVTKRKGPWEGEGGEATPYLPLRPNFHREWEREKSGYEASSRHCCWVGTLRSDNGDGNENVEKAIGLLRLAKQHPCTCITLFGSFPLRHYKTTTWKCIISSFVENVNTWQRLSFPFSGLSYSLF